MCNSFSWLYEQQLIVLEYWFGSEGFLLFANGSRVAFFLEKRTKGRLVLWTLSETAKCQMVAPQFERI